MGLCGSDAHWYEHGRIGATNLQRPLVLGHEICGAIVSGARLGERVVVDPAIPCLNCEQCQAGRHNLCAHLRFAGHGSVDGGLRGHMVWPDRSLVPLPDDISDVVGALLEPLGVALHAIDLADLRTGQLVAVTGCGPIGLLTIVALRAVARPHVFAIDPIPHRMAAAVELGAAKVPVSAGGTCDVVFETSGTNEGLAEAVELARPGGRVVVVGIPGDDSTTLNASAVRRKELTVVWCRRMLPGDLHRAVALGRDHPGALARLVTHRYPLARVGEAFSTLVDRRGVKVVVEPGPV